MVRRAILVFSLTLVLSGLGCGGSESSDVRADVNKTAASSSSNSVASSVAVIDIDEVARRLGRDVEVKQAIQHREGLLNQQLVELTLSYQNQINALQLEYGENATLEQTQALTGMQQEAIEKLTRVKNEASANLNEHRSAVINKFREQVRSFARNVAKEKGCLVVLTNWENVFTYDPAVDITSDVVAAMALAGFQQGNGEKPSAEVASEPGTTQLK